MLIALIGVYSLISNVLLLFSMAFLIGGFLAIGRFVPEPIEFAGKTITPQNLYIGLFVIGTSIPLVATRSLAGVRVLDTQTLSWAALGRCDGEPAAPWWRSASLLASRHWMQRRRAGVHRMKHGLLGLLQAEDRTRRCPGTLERQLIIQVSLFSGGRHRCLPFSGSSDPPDALSARTRVC